MTLPKADPHKSIAKGDTVGGRYVVDGQLGRGGMGRVLKVHHKELGQYFAMKVPKRSHAMSEVDRKNFLREALLASSVNHQHICNVFDYGEDEHFGLFMVMEYIAGKNLREKIQYDGGMNSKVSVDVMMQISNAIAFVHEKTILHGDIKSENILMSRTHDGKRHLKLLDFGLARQIDADTGRVQGTPHYLAPERIQGAPRSQSADVYALGILFYEIIAGEVPFQGSVEDVMRSHLQEEIPPPSLLSKKSIDERIDTIIAKATQKNPLNRYPTVDSLFYELKTLSNMLGNKPIKKRSSRLSTATSSHKSQESTDAELLGALPLPTIAFDQNGFHLSSNLAFNFNITNAAVKTLKQFSELFVEAQPLWDHLNRPNQEESMHHFSATLLSTNDSLRIYLRTRPNTKSSASIDFQHVIVLVPEF